MSDVLVRGMEMPLNCRMCRYMVNENNTFVGLSIPAYCQCIDVNIKDDSVRHPDCPLIEVPKHGDLVDLSDMVHPNDSMRIMTIDEQLRRTCEGWGAHRKEYVVIKAEGNE